MKTILIFEGNAQQAEKIGRLVQASFPEITSEACTSVAAAREAALTDYRSIILISLDQDAGSGLELAKWLRKIPVYRQTPIIFIASSAEHSVETINQTRCLSYILTPNLARELPKALADALTLHEVAGTKSESDYIQLSTKGATFKVRIADIIYIEINNKLTEVVTTEHRYELKRVPLQRIIAQLPDLMFQQCHRSFIVNINYISTVETEGRTTVLRLRQTEQPIPVGMRYAEKFR